ncbi:MAG: hypothetical protein RBT59_08620 [Arcobacteraceae bacterium]|jgi:hypothetical protein|nr:hypothetical protein [Arcobacteraceae bacterium]
MEKTTFLILLIVFLILFGIKRAILEMLQKSGKLLWLTQEMATYIFFGLFILLMVVGVLFTSSTETDFANVNQGFEKIRTGGDKDKPHRYFDINMDWIKGNE